MDRSPRFGFRSCDYDAHFRLAFATASPHGLTSPHDTNSQAHSSKGTQSLDKLAPTACMQSVSGSISLIGIVLGGSQSLSRSLFSQMIPRAQEAQYFAIYELSERGTSWIGTFLFGLSLTLTGSYRISILALISFFIIGGILFSRVNLKRAIQESGNELPPVI